MNNETSHSELRFGIVVGRYSLLLQKTRAHHKLVDDVPGDVKSRRHMELTDTFRDIALEMNNNQIGQHHLVLIEGVRMLLSFLLPF